MITYYLRNFWQDCRIDSIQRIRETIPNINDETLLEILEGKKKTVTEDGIHFTIEDDHEEDEMYLSRDRIQESFEYKFMDLASQVMGYSKGLHLDTDEDRRHYYSLLENTFEKIHKLENNWKEFCALIKCNINLKIEDYLYDEDSLEVDDVDVFNYVEHLDSPNKASSYKDLVSEYLSTLNFSFKYALDYLIREHNYQTIELLKLDLSNGLKYIPEHKKAQSELDTLRGDDIFPEDILECIWNSGWLSPNGELYGCPDLDHTNFSSKLIKFLGLEETNNPDRVLEKAGFIKFSMGRWLYMDEDLTPTVEQLRTILEWNDKRNKSLKLCIGDGSTLTNVDIVETRLHSLLKSN